MIASIDAGLRDRLAEHIFAAGAEQALKAADYERAVKSLAVKAYAGADAMLAQRITGAGRYGAAENALMGQRWSGDQADALIFLVNAGRKDA